MDRNIAMMILGAVLMVFLNYYLWIMHVQGQLFDSRWKFFFGMLPFGMIIFEFAHLFSNVRESCSGSGRGFRSYWRR